MQNMPRAGQRKPLFWNILHSAYYESIRQIQPFTVFYETIFFDLRKFNMKLSTMKSRLNIFKDYNSDCGLCRKRFCENIPQYLKQLASKSEEVDFNY